MRTRKADGMGMRTRTFLTALSALGAIFVAGCGGQSDPKSVMVITTVQQANPTTSTLPGSGGVAPVVSEPVVTNGEGGNTSDVTVSPGSTIAGGGNGNPIPVPPGGGVVTTVPQSIAQQMASNFAAYIAQELNQKAGPFTESDVQKAGASWLADGAGDVTVDGYKGTKVENVKGGVKVSVTVGTETATSYACAGGMAGVSQTACA